MTLQREVVRLIIESRTELFAFILSAVRDYDAAEDVLQNVSLVLCDKADEYQSGTSFQAWAREIARRKILEYFRRSKRVPDTMPTPDLEQLLTAFNEIERKSMVEERIRALRQCLSLASMQLKELFRLRYEERLSLDQIASRLSKKTETIRKSLYRGRLALRECIDRRLGLAK